MSWFRLSSYFFNMMQSTSAGRSGVARAEGRAAVHQLSPQGGRDRAMVPDADSRVDAYMCHETIKPVARDKGGVTGCDAFRLRGRPCRIIRNRVMRGRACIA